MISGLSSYITGFFNANSYIENAPQDPPYGYRVLDIYEQSPAAKANLISYFDFIVKANDLEVNPSNNILRRTMDDNREGTVKLQIYNWKSQTYRDVEIHPSMNWGGKSLLGMTIRYDKHKINDKDMLHKIEPHSPGELAELQSDYDYILGTTEEEIYGYSEFLTLLEDNLNKQIQLFVYNIQTDSVRKCFLTPDNNWGGKGICGIEIGTGYFHMIPYENRLTNVAIPPNIENIGSEELISESELPRPLLLTPTPVITPKTKSNEENEKVNNEGVNPDGENIVSSVSNVESQPQNPPLPINNLNSVNDEQNIAKTPGPTDEDDDMPIQ